MALNMWTEDFFLPQDMGLDLLADQKGGQYDDLKEHGRPVGDWKPNQREDVVEQLSVLSSQGLDDMGWMETDIGSFIDALASHQQEFSYPTELFDLTSSLSNESVSQSVFNDILDPNMCFPVIRDSTLTPPESPEQVLPVIQLESGFKNEDLSPASLTATSNFLVSEKTDFFQDGLNCIALSEEPLKEELQAVQDSTGFIASPLSADDVESMLSSPEPASPQSPNTSSFILSSPELYKVIAAPSSISNRFSPYSYSKPKAEQKSKSLKSSRAKKIKSDILVAPEDVSNLNKKDRKRLQNKNAAIRYRHKKKEESKTIYSEVDGLEDTNQELKTKVEDLEREIRYMKNLMQDVQKAKTLAQ